MKTMTVTRNKSFEWSFGIHAALVLIALLPFAHKVVKERPLEYILDFSYAEIPETKMSGSSGLQARSPIYNDDPEPTTSKPDDAPVPAEEREPVEEITIAENHAEVVSESSDVSETDVTSSADAANGPDAETNASGGGLGSPIQGDEDGAAIEGEGGGGDGLEGDGIITRRVIYREDIGRIAKVNGRVTLNVCIDREGKVIYAAYDPEKTTITDNAIIKEASFLALKYRYERNYSAPKRECGQLTFIFRLEHEVEVK